jgi:hypothetical protein
MDLWLFEVVADALLVRKGLKSATAAWLAALLLVGTATTVILLWRSAG